MFTNLAILRGTTLQGSAKKCPILGRGGPEDFGCFREGSGGFGPPWGYPQIIQGRPQLWPFITYNWL